MKGDSVIQIAQDMEIVGADCPIEPSGVLRNSSDTAASFRYDEAT